jgi:hypothetical protein
VASCYLGSVSSVIHNSLHPRGGVKLARDGKEVKGANEKKDNKGTMVPNNKGKKRGRKRKSLTPIPSQDVDIPLVVGGALVVGEATVSPLTGGVNGNNSSLGPSIGMSSYDDATIGDNMDINANEHGDGGTSDAEGEGYECVVSFKDEMKKVELERFFYDAVIGHGLMAGNIAC